MGDCVKFTKITPSKIIEIYRELDFQRRKLEEQRMNIQDRLLKKEDKEVVINNNQEEVEKCRNQKQEIVLKDNVVAAEKFQNSSREEDEKEKETIKLSEESARRRVRQSRDGNNQQTEDILDKEIELIRRLMMKISQRKIVARKKRSDNKRKIVADYESKASGALQYKVWIPGEQQQTTTTIEKLTSKDRLQNKVWDPGGKNYPNL